MLAPTNATTRSVAAKVEPSTYRATGNAPTTVLGNDVSWRSSTPTPIAPATMPSKSDLALGAMSAHRT